MAAAAAAEDPDSFAKHVYEVERVVEVQLKDRVAPPADCDGAEEIDSHVQIVGDHGDDISVAVGVVHDQLPGYVWLPREHDLAPNQHLRTPLDGS